MSQNLQNPLGYKTRPFSGHKSSLRIWTIRTTAIFRCYNPSKMATKSVLMSIEWRWVRGWSISMSVPHFHKNRGWVSSDLSWRNRRSSTPLSSLCSSRAAFLLVCSTNEASSTEEFSLASRLLILDSHWPGHLSSRAVTTLRSLRNFYETNHPDPVFVPLFFTSSSSSFSLFSCAI